MPWYHHHRPTFALLPVPILNSREGSSSSMCHSQRSTQPRTVAKRQSVGYHWDKCWSRDGVEARFGLGGGRPRVRTRRRDGSGRNVVDQVTQDLSPALKVPVPGLPSIGMNYTLDLTRPRENSGAGEGKVPISTRSGGGASGRDDHEVESKAAILGRTPLHPRAGCLKDWRDPLL